MVAANRDLLSKADIAKLDRRIQRAQKAANIKQPASAAPSGSQAASQSPGLSSSSAAEPSKSTPSITPSRPLTYRIRGLDLKDINGKLCSNSFKIADRNNYLNGWYDICFYETRKMGSKMFEAFLEQETKGSKIEYDEVLSGTLETMARIDRDFITSAYRHLPVILTREDKVGISHSAAFAKGIVRYDKDSQKFVRSRQVNVIHPGMPFMSLTSDYEILGDKELDKIDGTLQIEESAISRDYRFALTDPSVTLIAPVGLAKILYSHPEFTHPNVTNMVYAPWDVKPAGPLSPELDLTKPVMAGYVPNQPLRNI